MNDMKILLSVFIVVMFFVGVFYVGVVLCNDIVDFLFGIGGWVGLLQVDG